MQDMVEPTPSERDEKIYSAWEAGKSLRGLAREFETSVKEIEQALDRMLPVFDSSTNLRALKREIQQMEDLTRDFFTIAKRDKSFEAAHLCARLNERTCAMRGLTSLNIRLDPYSAQTQQQPTEHEEIRRAIFAIARGDPDYQPKTDGNGAPPIAPSTDDQNRSNSEQFSTRDGPERDTDAT
jgi:hypothetical protein